MPVKKANDRIQSAGLWHVYTASQSAADLSAYQAYGKCPVAFQALGTGTVVVKRQADDAVETVPVVSDRIIRGQCSALVSTDVSVIFYWP